MINYAISFPTKAHKEAAEAIKEYFQNIKNVDTILVVNSCARGQAVAGSDLDLAILAAQGTTSTEIGEMEAAWLAFAANSPALLTYQALGPHALLHLDLITGDYRPGPMETGGMPDSFEIEIGNQVRYSVPLGQAGPFFLDLRRRWLPYYDSALRSERLRMITQSCEYDLSCIRPYLERGLHFQAFDRLTVAFQKFLQALFISRRVYPIAYNKWIRMQVEVWLGMPDLYSKLPSILSVCNIESFETAEKAVLLKTLLDGI
ncbi:MAG TPA: nucleotidyltransferase domain-containing protein [Puia sp.]|uniref:nucleotidyltransferase domain-containing protein n=1 Tax=Puia sp. TaxID=2045100 RepID=UPI002C63533F|nr:nucleotidyltransferase domain-containing protein [Puia sp.]HVU94446.1 nucleotidyltransferase domain-containing protein [Puia sp.]